MSNLSFIQYLYCDVCKINHRQGLKHVYHDSHKDNVSKVLMKMQKKISVAKSAIVQPTVNSTLKSSPVKDTEQTDVNKRLLISSRLGIPVPDNIITASSCPAPHRNNKVHVWCYFCQQELPRDLILGEISVEWEAFIQHLCSDEHKSHIDIFWNLNRVVSTSKKDVFYLTEDDLKNFRVNAEKAIRHYTTEADKMKHREYLRLRYQKELHHRIVSDPGDMSHKQPRGGRTVAASKRQGSHRTTEQSALSGMRTIAAKGVGLTCLNLQKVDEAQGNIHSGAAPPWLNSHTAPVSMATTSVKPSIEDYEKHLEAVKKGKLPPDRVGAKEKLAGKTLAVGDTWLPSFGRVWSKSSRTHIRKQFSNTAHNNRRSHPTSTVTSGQVTAHSQPHPSNMSYISEEQPHPPDLQYRSKEHPHPPDLQYRSEEQSHPPDLQYRSKESRPGKIQPDASYVQKQNYLVNSIQTDDIRQANFPNGGYKRTSTDKASIGYVKKSKVGAGSVQRSTRLDISSNLL